MKAITAIPTVALAATTITMGMVGTAHAKASADLTADHKAARVGQTLQLKGYYGDDGANDSELAHARFCVELRTGRTGHHHWTHVGPCLRPGKTPTDNGEEAYYHLNIPLIHKGRYTFRGIVLDSHHREVTFTLPLVVTVR